MALGSDLPPSDLGIIRELMERPQWVAWKQVRAENGKPKKLPIDPKTGRKASVMDPRHWGWYDEAVQFALGTDVNGIGFVLTGIEGYTVIDLDGVVDPETGEIAPWARDVVEAFNTYTEVSPSGTGLHIWCRGRPSGDRCRSRRIEMYVHKRYITITGKYVELAQSDEIEDRQRQIEELYEEAFETVPIYGHFEPKTQTAKPAEPEERDQYGWPLPTGSQWTLEEALYYCQRALQDGKPTVPVDKVLALNANDKRFNRIWRKIDKAAERSCGDDQSRWDLAIANRLFLADIPLTWHDLIAILIDFREQYDQDQTKIMRADYWARNISKASEMVSRRREAKATKEQNERDIAHLDEIQQRFDEATEDKDKEKRSQAIRDLCERIGCPEIIKITRSKRKNNHLFTIHFGDEYEDKIEGDITLLTSQTKFRNVIAQQLLRFIKPMTPKKWSAVATMLLAAVEEEPYEHDAKAQTQMIELLQGYLAQQPRPPEFCAETYLMDGPWWWKGKLLIKLASFETYLRRYHRLSMERRELSERLRLIGVEQETRSYRVGGRVSSMSLYVVPDGHEFHELANNTPRKVEIIDDEETDGEKEPE